MATIKVRVQGEIATNLTPEVKLVCQNEKYDVEFEFDEDWSNSNFKTALFIYNGQLIAIPFDGTICKIPALYETELLHIGVKSNDVIGLHTTTPAKVVYLLSANDLTSNKIPEPSKDVYEEIISLLNKYISGGGSVDLSDYQKKVDDRLETQNKEIVGAINEVKGLAETARMVFGETEGTAYEGNKGKANADNIAKLQNELAVVNVALEQSGLVKKYKQPITQEYNERITADGANVLNGSKAVLKKVVGSTVRYDADENGLNGKLANASFGGIESKNADGTETSTLAFLKTDTPLGVTIDFENKKITEEYADYTFTGQETVASNGAYGSGGYYRYSIRQKGQTLKTGIAQNGICDKYPTDKSQWSAPVNECIRFGQNNNAIYLILLRELTVDEVRALIAGMTVRYPIDTPTETDFTAEQAASGNEYTAYKNGTEKVLENDGKEYGADNTLTQDYILVTAVE